MATITALVSGKGGTGKTTLCAALASCLAAEGKRVLCIDLDIGLRNLDLALGMAEEHVLPFTELINGHADPASCTPHPAIPNLFLLTAPMRVEQAQLPADALDALLVQASESFDMILLDAPAGLGAGFDLAIHKADRVLLVAAADPASLRDAAQTAQTLHLRGKRDCQLLINRLRPGYFRAARTTVDDVMDAVGLRLVGLVPEDNDVPLAAACGRALVLYSRRGAAAACLRISRRLRGLYVPLSFH